MTTPFPTRPPPPTCLPARRCGGPLARRTHWALSLCGFCAALAGCASAPPAGDARAYDESLAPWRGASEALLRSQWGPPQDDAAVGAGRQLTYVTYAPRQPAGATVGISLGGFGFGSRSAVGAGVGVSAPLTVQGPACTTRFLVEQGVVVSWTFDGAGCGAR